MDEPTAERSLRDLIGLLALPALWVGRDGATVLRLMSEAVERVVRLDVLFIDVPFVPHQPRLTVLRLGGAPASPAQADAWKPGLESWGDLPIGRVATLCETLSGPLQVVRLSLGYSARDGSVWFAAADTDFSNQADAAFLRAAATLAATGLRAARIAYEREEASRAKDQFLAMLGHELRNPLAPIVTSMASIKRREGGELSGHLAIIDRQVKHLSRLVDDLLDVARITRGKVELQREPLSLRTTLARAVESVAPLLEERHHMLEVVVPDDDARVLGDATRLVQVFSNLLTNAARYTDPGGAIRVTMRLESSFVDVCVEDNGRGIEAKLLPRIFTIFEQGEATPERAAGGLGIGLALVKNLV
ncbi:MAG: HAMP domain-containing sensor histidine kinase [Burkholderiaceae bacterium]